MLDDYAWHAGNSNDEPHPVGQKKPNAFGLYDMHGNVLEWCLDQYAAGFYATLPVNKPSLGPINIPGAIRYPHVTRGGSWPDKPAQLRSAARRPSDRWWNRSDPRIRKGWWWLTDADFLGFRIVRPLEENDALKGYRAKMPVDNR
jgi:formylglycine-generating enzyme required for sulfatase activity